MSNYTPHLLSESTDGKLINITTTATPGDLIHTAVVGTDNLDEIFIYAANVTSTVKRVTVEWGGTTSPDDLVEDYYIQPEAGWKLIIPGHRLQNGLAVRVFSDSANVINIGGYVNRHTL